ncbi:MAG: ATP-binding protein, partial [Anaerolineae bacterium]
ELRSEIAPDLPSCLVGDPGRIQQMLLNLVENAIRFTSQGGILLRLYLAEAGFWGIEVADTGPGIPPEAQGDIFEPFRPGEESPTPQHEGVGLGLAIVKQLALMMGGDVHLASEAGRGSRFTVRLPLATCKPTTAADALPAEFEPG